MRVYFSEKSFKFSSGTNVSGVPSVPKDNNSHMSSANKDIGINIKEAFALAGVSVALAATIAVVSQRVKPSSLADNIIVVGKEKVKNILNKLTADDFDANKHFRANLHIHSNYSDGKLSPLEILNQAKAFGDKLPAGEKFVFSLTDHDSVAGVRIIVNEIRKNPDKYSNVIFIPGVECSTTFRNSNIVDGPVNLDYLIYGFNPNDEKLIFTLASRKNALLKATESVFHEVNSTLGEKCFDIQSMQKNGSKQLVNVCSNGYINELYGFMRNILAKKNFPLQTIESLFVKHFGHSKMPLNANMNTTDVAKFANDINAFSVLAHPGKISFARANLIQPATDTTNAIIKSLFDNGCGGLEYHYMAYKRDAQAWWDEIRCAFESFKILFARSGGYDTHLKTISAH